MERTLQTARNNYCSLRFGTFLVVLGCNGIYISLRKPRYQNSCQNVRTEPQPNQWALLFFVQTFAKCQSLLCDQNSYSTWISGYEISQRNSQSIFLYEYLGPWYKATLLIIVMHQVGWIYSLKISLIMLWHHAFLWDEHFGHH